MPVAMKLVDGTTRALRQHCERRIAGLKTARQPWLDFTREVAKEILPNRLPYLLDPMSKEKGGQQNTHVCDAVGHTAVETTASGITHGTMPSSSPWFSLAIRGSELQDDDDLRLFLQDGSRVLLDMHNQANTALVIPECQKEWVAFGTAAALVVEDDEADGFRLDPMSAGEYLIADDATGRVDTCYREITLTIGQLGDEFGPDCLSKSSKAAWDRGDFDIVVGCVHAIEPDRDGLNPYGEDEGRRWRSVYYEVASDTGECLAVRGYDKFPVLCWRWGKLPGTAYGYGRGHDVLPHMVRLRKLIYRYGQALAFKSQPPLQLPPGVQAHELRYLPGGSTPNPNGQPIRTLFEVDLELKEVQAEIERTRQDIRDTLGSTLIASLRRITHQMTAREADLRTAQDLTEILPALLRQNEELLNPYIEWLWQIAADRGRLPLPPRSLEGQTIDIELISPLALKQRQAEVDAIIRVAAVAAEIAKVDKRVVDNLDVDTMIRRVTRIEGAPADILKPIEQVKRERDAMQQALLAQQQAAAAQQAADIGKTAAEAQVAEAA